MAEEMKMSGSSKGWNTLNTILGVGGIAAAAGIGIPAYFSGNKNKCGARDGGDSVDCYITRMESVLRAENAELKADQKTDAKILELFRVVANNKEEAGKQIAENAVQIALNKQASDYQFIIANKEFANVGARIDTLTGRVDHITKEVVPISAICPQPMPGCVPVSFQGQVVETADTKTTSTIVGNRKGC